MLGQPGRLLTKGRLLRAVWGTAYADEAHYLHVYVSRLRRKLDAADPTRPRERPDRRGAGRRLPDRARTDRADLERLLSVATPAGGRSLLGGRPTLEAWTPITITPARRVVRDERTTGRGGAPRLARSTPPIALRRSGSRRRVRLTTASRPPSACRRRPRLRVAQVSAGVDVRARSHREARRPSSRSSACERRGRSSLPDGRDRTGDDGPGPPRPATAGPRRPPPRRYFRYAAPGVLDRAAGRHRAPADPVGGGSPGTADRVRAAARERRGGRGAPVDGPRRSPSSRATTCPRSPTRPRRSCSRSSPPARPPSG